MRLRTGLIIGLMVGSLMVTGWGILRAQKPFKEWPAIEYENFPIPPGADRPSEWTRARLRYPDLVGYPNFSANPRYLGFAGYWTMDYPRSDRHLLEGVKRLTRIDARPLEQVVSLDGTDEINNWPVAYAVEVGYMNLPEVQAQQLRDYLDRGGFLMVDDFHANREWKNFEENLKRIYPNRDWVDIPNSDPIFHVLYDLEDRVQIPGWGSVQQGVTYEKDESGRPEHWRAIYDEKGRVVIAICHNMDMGDAWEHSDNPRYPEKMASLAYRIAMNYFVYDLTH